MSDPYLPPAASLASGPAPSALLLIAARGQKLVIWAILLQFATIAVIAANTLRPAASAYFAVAILPLMLAALIMSAIGVMRMGEGLGYSVVIRVFLVLFMFVGCINILVLLILSSQVNNKLTAAGYKIGLMGAKL